MLLILLGIYVLVWAAYFAGLSIYWTRQRTGIGLLPIALMALTWPIFLPFMLLYVVVLLPLLAYRSRSRDADTTSILDEWEAEMGEAKLAEIRAQYREHMRRLNERPLTDITDEAEDD